MIACARPPAPLAKDLAPSRVHPSSAATRRTPGGGSVAQTPISLGANFPANTLSTDAYELALFAPANQTGIYYEVTRLNTGNVATGAITTDGAAITLPAPTALLTYSWNYRTNNATALSVGLDIMSDYIETDD